SIRAVVVIAKDAIASAGSQNRCIYERARLRQQTVPESEEKRFVFNDGTTEAERVLMKVAPWSGKRLSAHSLVRPGIRIESAVLHIPRRRTAILIGAGSSGDLNLRVSAS